MMIPRRNASKRLNPRNAFRKRLTAAIIKRVPNIANPRMDFDSSMKPPISR